MKQQLFKKHARAVVQALVFVWAVTGAAQTGAPPEGVPKSDRTHSSDSAPTGQAGVNQPGTNHTDLRIRLWQSEVARDPDNNGSYNRLAAAYVQKARETGDISYFQLAESSLRASLKLESTHPDAAQTFTQVATVHLAEHRFREAAEDAAKAISLSPDELAAYPCAGDAQMELGDYDASQKFYDHLIPPSDGLQHPGIEFLAASHGAGLAWIKGDTAHASEDLQHAILTAEAMHLPPENIAWTEFMLGEQYFQLGDIAAAEREELASLQMFPRYHRALAAMGQVRAAQDRLSEAIAFYKQAVAIIPLPLYVAALGDVYAASGDRANAERQYATVEFIGRLNAINQQVYNRELALFYADHGRKLPEALTLARKEYEVRQDIYTSDAVAWALLKNGQAGAAKIEMERALRMGTEDALLEYHAGMIYAALNDNASAQKHLERALTLNPHFHVLFTKDAVSTLARLKTSSQANSAPHGGSRDAIRN